MLQLKASIKLEYVMTHSESNDYDKFISAISCTPIHNEILDKWMFELDHSVSKVLIFLASRKRNKFIGYSLIIKRTNLSKTSVYQAIDLLLKKIL